MKKTNIIQRLSLFLFILVFATPMCAQSNIFSIGSKADWKKFCERVNAGEHYLDAKMTKDIDLGKEIIRVGVFPTGYTGTFDGQGHKLSVDWEGGDFFLAPFMIIGNSTIKNVHVTGKMKSKTAFVSGLIGGTDGTVNVVGCVTDVKITNEGSEVPSLSAGMLLMIGKDVKLTITDCIVKGDINGTTAISNQGIGGFVCEQEGGSTCIFENCLYAGTNNSMGGNTFAPDATMKNCYYLNTCGKAQGVQTTAAELASGEVTAKLQNGRASQVWGQMIGTDAQPLPTNNAKKRVYKVEFAYNNKVMATRYTNTGGKVKLPTAREILGATYDENETYTLSFSGGFSATTAITGDTKITVTVNSSTTGIDDVRSEKIERNGVVYDLQGRCVAESADNNVLGTLPAGVYIVNGRKVVVR